MIYVLIFYKKSGKMYFVPKKYIKEGNLQMKNRKNILVTVVTTLLTLAVLMQSSLNAFANGEFKANAYVNVQSTLNLRQKPSTNSKVILKLKPGDLLEAEELKNGWSKVILEDGTEGFVKTDYIVKVEQDLNKYELISVAVINNPSSPKNRNFNMAKACEKINGLVLETGDEFNWYGTNGEDGVVGCASKENGYKEANIIVGKKYVKGYGGGVCQVSTAVYNCIYKLDIKPTEHHHHSLQSSYVEKGMDATVAWPSKNFVFSNTKDYSIMFEAYTNKGQVVIAAYKVLE